MAVPTKTFKSNRTKEGLSLGFKVQRAVGRQICKQFPELKTTQTNKLYYSSRLSDKIVAGLVPLVAGFRLN